MWWRVEAVRWRLELVCERWWRLPLVARGGGVGLLVEEVVEA